ncbi:hypothetical protein OIU77_004793 [Salix suchowensis]|uniref:Uncharacterized protein n=1 Tax=Salix suchowensis TaxID=1278906 RepID=A0ABQ9AVU6_9ROSI|nr:hypothetical protein OIU77_004793 [Salix suchowensis]
MAHSLTITPATTTRPVAAKSKKTSPVPSLRVSKSEGLPWRFHFVFRQQTCPSKDSSIGLGWCSDGREHRWLERKCCSQKATASATKGEKGP